MRRTHGQQPASLLVAETVTDAVDQRVGDCLRAMVVAALGMTAIVPTITGRGHDFAAQLRQPCRAVPAKAPKSCRSRMLTVTDAAIRKHSPPSSPNSTSRTPA